jgi:hypothetical protein
MTIYYVSLKYGKDTLVFDRQGVRLSSDTPDCFQLTPDQLPVFQIPDWVRKGVIYQSFPIVFAMAIPAKIPILANGITRIAKLPLPRESTLGGAGVFSFCGKLVRDRRLKAESLAAGRKT